MRPPAFRVARRRKDIGLRREMLSAIDVAGDQEDADPGHDVADNRDQTATDVARCTSPRGGEHLGRVQITENSASEAKIWNTSRPPGVVVSIASCNDRNPTPRSSSLRTVSTRCGSDRPSRSSRHTTRVSPGRSDTTT